MFGCGIGSIGKKFGFRNRQKGQKSRRTRNFDQFNTEKLDIESSCCSFHPDEEIAWMPDAHRPVKEALRNYSVRDDSMKEAFKRGYLMRDEPVKQVFNRGYLLRDEPLRDTFKRSYSTTQEEPFKDALKHTYSMRDEPPPLTVNPNEVFFGNTLGKGASGTVYRGRLGCEEVAIKIIRPQESVFELGTEPLELYMGQSVSHPNLVKVLGVYVGNDRDTDGSNEVLEQDVSIYESPPGVRRTSSSLFSDMAQDLSDGPAEIWIVMEYCNRGSLREAIKAGEFFEDAHRQRPRILHVLFAALEVAAALEHLHSFGIIHGDLKSQNVMLTTSQILAKNFVCKVGDFGMSRPLTQIKTHISTFTAGTVSHMPPEVLKDGILTPAVDVFSFGMLLWELMAGELPFLGMNSGETMVSIVEGHRPEIPSFCPPMFADLIRRCWNPQRELRPSFKEITRMLKTMLGGPPIPANKIPAINHQEMNSTVPTMSSELLFSEGETGTTFYGTATDLSDNVCLSLVQDRPLSVPPDKPPPIHYERPPPIQVHCEKPTPVQLEKPARVQDERSEQVCEKPAPVCCEKPVLVAEQEDTACVAEVAAPDLPAIRIAATSSPTRAHQAMPKPSNNQKAALREIFKDQKAETPEKPKEQPAPSPEKPKELPVLQLEMPKEQPIAQPEKPREQPVETPEKPKEQPAVQLEMPREQQAETPKPLRETQNATSEADAETKSSESLIPLPPRISTLNQATDSSQSAPLRNGRRPKRTTPFPQWQAYLNAINESNKPLSRPRTKIPTSSSCPPSASSFD